MLRFSFKMRNLAVYYSLAVIIFVSIMIACASLCSVEIIGNDNIDLMFNTQAAIVTSLAQESLQPTAFVYLENSLYRSPPEYIYDELDLPSERVDTPAGIIFSEDFTDASPPNYVYKIQDFNDNEPVSQPEAQTETSAENEFDIEIADSKTLPSSGDANYTSVIALWLFIAASYSLKAGIIGKKVLGSYNL